MKIKIDIIIILVGLIMGGIFYWFKPYNQLHLNDIIPFWIIGAFLGSAILMFLLTEKVTRIAMLISFGFMIAVLLRIIYDITFVDPTHHNLAPFEIIGCGLFVIPSSFAGAYLTLLIKNWKK